jgi:hypothetical protein
MQREYLKRISVSLSSVMGFGLPTWLVLVVVILVQLQARDLTVFVTNVI